ncbi:MAG: 30S ribosomal protein S9, partial [Elusimicrobia bacterium]|nr:30S ribosomal protein S9 [Elusimicrobiota bacterium]
MAKNNDLIWATGRRKTSIAQVRLLPQGEGKVTVNTKPAEQYFHGQERHLHDVLLPLKVEGAGGWNVSVKVVGGGITGQAGAIRHGIARALAKLDEKLKKQMRVNGYL